MNYIIHRTVEYGYDEAIVRVTEELGREGFGVLTQIDVAATLKKKLDVDFRRYLILGACNPKYAYQALQAEPWIGSMLPCNVVVQEFENGRVEIAAVDPLASMQAISNKSLVKIAALIREKLRVIIDAV